MLRIDLETYSRCNLVLAGAYEYWADRSTGVWCMCYAFDDEAPEQWLPGEPVPPRVAEWIEAGKPCGAWNAQFERLGFNHVLGPQYGFPVPALEQWRCTMAQAQAQGYPGKLDKACRALDAEFKKDMDGHRVMLTLCRPDLHNAFITPERDPEKHAKLRSYCMDDVRTERAIAQKLRTLTDSEWADYHLSERINDRGVAIDRELAALGAAYAIDEREALSERMAELTGGAVTAVTQVARLKTWLAERHFFEVESLDREAINNFLADDDLDPEVRTALTLRQQGSNSSTSKFSKAYAQTETGRMRGAYVFCGAPSTGRFSSHGLQVHNLKSEVIKQPEAAIEAMRAGPQRVREQYGDLVPFLTKMLRPMVVPAPGHVFGVSDYSGIEARVLPWLAGAEHYLDHFRRGEDVYLVEASNIYRQPVTDADDPRRQIGKVSVLSLGFGGGANAFLAMAKKYGVVVPREEAEGIKRAWRSANPWAPELWRGLEQSAIKAVRLPGQVQQCGRIGYLYDGRTLWCRLPSGRLLGYPEAKVKLEDGPYGPSWQLTALKSTLQPKKGEKAWPRFKLYGGLLAENVTQAAARDLLVCAMHRLEAANLPVVLHVHDETVVELPREGADELLALQDRCMLDSPAWADGLPIATDTKIMERYGK